MQRNNTISKQVNVFDSEQSNCSYTEVNERSSADGGDEGSRDSPSPPQPPPPFVILYSPPGPCQLSQEVSETCH